MFQYYIGRQKYIFYFIVVEGPSNHPMNISRGLSMSQVPPGVLNRGQPRGPVAPEATI